MGDERWFSDEELAAMSRPTMEVAIEAIEGRQTRTRQGAVRAREARVPVHARHAGRRNGGPDLLRQGEARRRGRARGVGVEPGAELEADGAEDRRDRPANDRPVARGDLARALDRRRRAQPGSVRDLRGRGEADLHHEPLWVGTKAGAQRPLRARRLGRHRLRPRLVLRPRRVPALLHPLRVHERAGADQLDRLPGLSLGAARGLRARPLRLALVQGPRRHPRPPLGALRA